MRTDQQKVQLFESEMVAMNKHINSYGQIARSSAIIKHWHDLDNQAWVDILSIAYRLDDEGSMSLNNYTLKDIERLLQHINDYGIHCGNVVYPHPKLTAKLHKSVSHFSADQSVKTVAFKAMMNMREAYCKMINVDLPNQDSSQGLLDPKPRDTLFEFGARQ